MKLILTKNLLVAGLATLVLALPAHAAVNKSVKIESGGTSNGASSVNGSITVGDDATVTGKLSTVNGTIRVGDRARIEVATTVNGAIKISGGVQSEDLETVNGSIRIASQVTVDGAVSAVNGSIDLESGSSVSSDVSNVNGDIDLTGSTVGGDVSTTNGDVRVMEGAVIRGDLEIEKPRGWNNSRSSKEPKVVIGPGSRVEGVIRLERKVKLYISDSASVGGVEGVMSMDDAIRFSGNRP